MALSAAIMVDCTTWFSPITDSKVRINSREIYSDLSFEIVEKLDNNLSVTEIINWIKSKTIEAFINQYHKSPQVGALNNAIGRWNEFIAISLLTEIALEMNRSTGACIAIFSLPNSRGQSEATGEVYSKFLSLFSKDDFTTGKALAKIGKLKNQIFMPSPDYIIAVLGNEDIFLSIQSLLEQQAREPGCLAVYNFLKGKLYIEELKAVVSLKTSNRPDRRYQPLFEAAMIKAMGYILESNWQYYMVASELSSADRTIFTTAIAPHSIATQQNFKLVDETYLYNRKEDLVPLVEAAIKS